MPADDKHPLKIAKPRSALRQMSERERIAYVADQVRDHGRFAPRGHRYALFVDGRYIYASSIADLRRALAADLRARTAPPAAA